MAERIDLPAMPKGEPEEQMEELYRYLYRMAEALNANLAEIGGADLTDEERQLMLSLTQADGTTRSGGGAAYDWESAKTLKSLIIKTATWVKNTLDSWRISLLGEYVAQGKFGKYVRNTSMDVEVTPTGTTQNFKFHEIIEDLKKYEVNAKNYIKTGYLRTEGGLPVYGVAVGKDVVSFSEDGTETYNDSNKVGEFTADGISFFRKNNGSLVKLAELLSSALKFYYAGSLRTQMDTDGVKFYNGSTLLAELLGTALKFYYSGSLRTQMDTDGIKFYNGSTMLAQLKSGELDFYQGGNLAMKLTSTRLGFYNSGTEYMYLSGGKLYVSGPFDLQTTNLEINSDTSMLIGKEYTSGYQTGAFTLAPGLLRFANGVNSFKVSANGGTVTETAAIMFSGSITPDSSHAGGGFTMHGMNFVMAKRSNQTADPWLIPYADQTCQIGSSSRRFANVYFKAIDTNTMVYDGISQRSSIEYKKKVRKAEGKAEQIDELNPVTFVYRNDPKERTHYGLIYEETLPVMPEICVEDDGVKGINYVELVPVLLKEIQDLRKRTAMLEKRVEELEGRE